MLIDGIGRRLTYLRVSVTQNCNLACTYCLPDGKVAFTPHTGRTHQLRVHASNPLGLDAPIVGDRLYGRTAPEYGERLLLHAESLAFVHPVSGAELVVTSPAPF